MKKILLFDMDGTIAESGHLIHSGIKDILKKLCNDYEIGIVGGGTYQKIIDQLDGFQVKHLFSECGCVYHLDNNLLYKKDIRQHKLFPFMDTLIKKTLEYLSKVDYKITGHFIDIRCGIIYISLIGLCATELERKEFIKVDEKNGYREVLIKLLKNEAENLDIIHNVNIMIGGSVGICISPLEWDKVQILEYFSNTDEIYYFGDKYTPNGNDYRLLNHLRIHAFPVNNPEETFCILIDRFFKNQNKMSMDVPVIQDQG
jgi:HAD superfamily hydrolase (TIGR01484 family)